MRFLIDQGLSPEIARELRLEGIDARHVMELGLEAASDEDILREATVDGRVLLTSDLDYAELASRSASACVVVFRMQRLKPRDVLRRLREVVAVHGPRLSTGVIVSVGAARHRISENRSRREEQR